MSLTDKQAAFINEYLIDFNATQAAIRAGYSEKTARQIGSQNLSKVDIAEEIQRRVNDLTMKADEALILLGNQARASMKDFIEIDETKGTFSLNFKDIDDNKLQAIKSLSISNTPNGTNYRFELYDAQSALKEIIRLHRLDNGQATENSHIILKTGMDISELLP